VSYLTIPASDGAWQALYFMSINFSIHAVMYTYFFLMAVGRKPRWFNPMWITTAQISQVME
jgi:elongation of very long chain fatty acids protein 6